VSIRTGTRDLTDAACAISNHHTGHHDVKYDQRILAGQRHWYTWLPRSRLNAITLAAGCRLPAKLDVVVNHQQARRNHAAYS
jgi:hypothetical protein